MKLIKYVEPAPMDLGGASACHDHGYGLRQATTAFDVPIPADCDRYDGGDAYIFQVQRTLSYPVDHPVKSTFEANLVKIYVFGRPAVGDLQRPFKSAPGLFGMGQGEVKKRQGIGGERREELAGGVKEE